MMPRKQWLILVALLLLAGTAAPRPALAVISGPCSSCHTMHYSQGGGVLAQWGTTGPYGALLTNDCAGCHTGTNNGTFPYVNASSAPAYNNSGAAGNALAGGNFYWVRQASSDALGHNVAGLTSLDATLSGPPGFATGRAAADGSKVCGGGNWPAGQQVTCAGIYGCHGTHAETNGNKAIRGAHHGGLSNETVATPGTSRAGGYRMLLGIAGKEDANWEYTFAAADHNQYKGVDSPGSGADLTTVSALCARCHGLYHSPVSGVGTTSPWLRHPTDYDLGRSGGEYASYNGGAGYNTSIPLASTNVSTTLATPNVGSAAGQAIITCLSCHRAHASPYRKALRWNYRAPYTVGGLDGFGGCAVCHSSKN